MKIALVFFQFISFSLGLSALIVSFYQYWKTKDKSLRYYIPFLLLFTARIVLNNILFLLRSSSEMLDANLLKNLLLFYQISADLTFLMLLAVPLFFHSLFPVPFKKAADAFFVVILNLCLILNLYPYINGIFGGLSSYPVMQISALESIGMVFIFIYLGLLMLLFYKKTPDLQKKNTAAAILAFFISFTLFDYFTAKNTYIFNRPDNYLLLLFNIGFYSFWNLFFLIFTGFNHHKNNPSGTAAMVITGDFLKHFSISTREKEVIEMVLAGKSNQDIADALFISHKTVKNHVHNVFQKTGAKNRMDLSFMIREFVK